jgi:plasmid maintenance system antidote protein VapI
MTTGKDLKMRRIGADVKAVDLAEAMGVTSSRITHIETRRLVTPDAAERYLAALSTCITKSTSPDIGEGGQR